MDKKRLEIVEVVERRRKWPAEDKARIMEDALAPGATVASVADRHGISRSQVYAWLRQARAGKLPGISVTSAACASFVPVRVEEPPASASRLPAPRPAPAMRRRVPVVEIALGNGRSLKVDEEIDAGGERAAIFYTLVRTAKLNGIEPEAYLREVLTRIGEHPINAIDALLPWKIVQSATLSVAA